MSFPARLIESAEAPGASAFASATAALKARLRKEIGSLRVNWTLTAVFAPALTAASRTGPARSTSSRVTVTL